MLHKVGSASLWSRRGFLQAASGLFSPENPPNIVFILADDLGYGDLGCYGGRIRTPNLDSMARDGVRFTCHESAAPVCTASRTALLMGMYAQRFGIRQLNSVIFPNTETGLPAMIGSSAVATIADKLRFKGYLTGHVGKWHLGHYAPNGNYRNSEFHPANRGFDFFRGVPYSSDMSPNVYDNGSEAAEFPDAERKNLTARFTQDALGFLELAQSQNSPFFLYLAYTAPHIPVEPSGQFTGLSGFGPYADVVAELDDAVGRILRVLGSNTVVLFSSDNGADQTQPLELRGENGGLKGGKFSVDEGGTRVPLIGWCPELIPGGRVCHELVSALDISSTLCSIAGYSSDDPHRGLSDGADLFSLLRGETAEVPRDKPLLYFRYWSPECAVIRRANPNARTAFLKFRFAAEGARLDIPEVYSIGTDADSGERVNIAPQLPPGLVAQVREDVRQQLSTFPSDNINLGLI